MIDIDNNIKIREYKNSKLVVTETDSCKSSELADLIPLNNHWIKFN